MSVTPVLLSPTQTREPGRTTARTIVQAILGWLLAVGTVVPAATLIIGSQWSAWLPAEAAAVLATIAAVSVAVSGTTAGIMAIPAVNNWLDRWHLSAGTSELYEPEPLPEFLPGERFADADGDGIADVAGE